MNLNRTGRPERGSAAAELVLVTQLLMLVLFLLIAAARLTDARLCVDSAAHQAARAASAAFSPSAASAAAAQMARSSLAERGVSCRALTVTTDTSGFRPGGEVTVQVTCSVTLSDLALLELPGTRTITARFSAPLDRWRTFQSLAGTRP